MNICFKRSKRLHLESDATEQEECSKTEPNIEPTESEKEGFFNKLSKLLPTSAALTTVIEQTSKPSHSKIILKLPPTLTSMYDPKYLDMSESDLRSACELAFQKLSITTDEAAYLEECTRLQSQSRLWFDHRAGRITASKFGSVSKASLNPPSASLVKEIMGEKSGSFEGVPALDWGKKNEATARKEYLKIARETHTSLTYHSAGFHVNVQYPYLGATPDGAIECECCGAGIIEIKCPYKYRQHKLTSDITDKSFCLQPNGEGKLELSHSHAYYLQIQGQLALCQKPHCDFIVWTEYDLFVERIYLDIQVFETIKPTLDNFFKVAILPQLLCGTKSHRNISSVSMDQDSYCHCKGPEEGRMIACDNSNCAVEWFHFHCVGLTRKPKGSWYCSESCKLAAK